MPRTRPLPQDTSRHVDRFLQESRNLGLILDKYQPWDRLTEGWEMVVHYVERDRQKTDTGGAARSRWFKGNEGRAKLTDARDWLEPNSHLDRTLLQKAVARWKRLTEGAQRTMLWTDAPLVVGLGHDSTLETAIALHPLYGFPYIPGSSLKGVARAAFFYQLAEQLGVPGLDNETHEKYGDRPTPFALLQQALEAEADKMADPLRALQANREVQEMGGAILNLEAKALAEVTAGFRHLFGWLGGVGEMIFYDALPAEMPEIVVEIMNPHFPDYYKGAKPPDDGQSPNPVTFLAVASGTPFRFAVGKRRSAVADQTAKQALAALKLGLTTLGVGGKTNSGYGFFNARKPPTGPRPQAQSTGSSHYVPASNAPRQPSRRQPSTPKKPAKRPSSQKSAGELSDLARRASERLQKKQGGEEDKG